MREGHTLVKNVHDKVQHALRAPVREAGAAARTTRRSLRRARVRRLGEGLYVVFFVMAFVLDVASEKRLRAARYPRPEHQRGLRDGLQHVTFPRRDVQPLERRTFASREHVFVQWSRCALCAAAPAWRRAPASPSWRRRRPSLVVPEPAPPPQRGVRVRRLEHRARQPPRDGVKQLGAPSASPRTARDFLACSAIAAAAHGSSVSNAPTRRRRARLSLRRRRPRRRAWARASRAPGHEKARARGPSRGAPS